MIELNGTRISEKDFERVAKQLGYKKEYEYPLVMKSLNEGEVWEFTAIKTGTCLKAPKSTGLVGEKSTNLYPHTDSRWTPCERPNKIYCGLTEAQWEQVINEKIVVEVTDNDVFSQVSNLVSFEIKDGEIKFKTQNYWWWSCRIHSSQPQFGGRADWVKDDDMISYKLENLPNTFVAPSHVIKWGEVTRWQVVKL